MVIGKGFTDRFLTDDEARAILAEGISQIETVGKKLLIIVPDSTRSSPMPLCFRTLTELLLGKAAQVDFMVALGTHLPMSEGKICQHLGITMAERQGRYAAVGLLNHNWQEGLKVLGTIPASEIGQLSGGLMAEDVRVQINSRLFDYDRLIICGPVFPHEVVGFSGGNKYFFPGVAGPEVIDFTHWLGAVITNYQTIGHQRTPIRAVIDRAASMIALPKSCFSMVVKGHHDLAGLYFGSPEESQAAAAELSAQVNVVYKKRPFKLVISVMPELYDDIWTAGKGMYKLEPVVADGGTVIIYAPHIDEVSYTHGKVLDRIGYHVRDYFLAQMERFTGEPRGVMAHASHVKGAGTYIDGVEKPRVNVILATGVSKERCQRINLGYMDPATLHIDEYLGREDEGILVVPRAGELLHRLETEKES
jgi:nickel-dependent lactate racemase